MRQHFTFNAKTLFFVTPKHQLLKKTHLKYCDVCLSTSHENEISSRLKSRPISSRKRQPDLFFKLLTMRDERRRNGKVKVSKKRNF